MELERPLLEELDRVASKIGYKRGTYTITIAHRHEYLYRGVETKVDITGSKGGCTHLKVLQPPTSSPVDLKIPWPNCFFNNVHYYTQVLPILQTHGKTPMSPKYYGSSLKSGGEFIILEDLEKTENYKRMTPFPGLNRIYFKAAISMLAYFHTTVKLWRSKNKQQFDSICSQFKPVLVPSGVFSEELTRCQEKLKEILKGVCMSMGKEQEEFQVIFKMIIPNLNNLTNSALEVGNVVEDQPWTILANCFTYTSNLFFKCHTVTGEVIDVGLEDWGAARLGSPALDISFLLFATPSTDLLSCTTSLINDYTSDVLSMGEMKEKHYPRYGIFGAFASMFIAVAKSIENQLDLKLDLVTSKTIRDESFETSDIPDLKPRLIAILKAAVEEHIFLMAVPE